MRYGAPQSVVLKSQPCTQLAAFPEGPSARPLDSSPTISAIARRARVGSCGCIRKSPARRGVCDYREPGAAALGCAATFGSWRRATRRFALPSGRSPQFRSWSEAKRRSAPPKELALACKANRQPKHPGCARRAIALLQHAWGVWLVVASLLRHLASGRGSPARSSSLSRHWRAKALLGPQARTRRSAVPPLLGRYARSRSGSLGSPSARPCRAALGYASRRAAITCALRAGAARHRLPALRAAFAPASPALTRSSLRSSRRVLRLRRSNRTRPCKNKQPQRQKQKRPAHPNACRVSRASSPALARTLRAAGH